MIFNDIYFSIGPLHGCVHRWEITKVIYPSILSLNYSSKTKLHFCIFNGRKTNCNNIKMEHLNKESEKSSTLKDVVIISSVIALLSLTLSRNFEVRENVLSAGKKLNVTPLCNESLLIFNRVPKVISQTDLLVFKKSFLLIKVRMFHFHFLR